MISLFNFERARGTAQKLVCLTLCAALVACTNIHDDRTRTQAEGAAAGAVGGAALGAAAGALLSKNKGQGALIGAAAGAMAGGLAGAAYGNSVANKKEGYAHKEDALDAQLRQTRHEATERHYYNNSLRATIARHQKKLASLKAAGGDPAVAVEQFELRSALVSKIGEVDREARSWQDTIDAHKAALRQASGDSRSAALRSNIDTLNTERNDLLQQRKQLISISEQAKQ